MWENFKLILNGRLKKVTKGGRSYYVANMTLIVPGVLDGSQGPLFYPDEEVGKNPQAWNGMPIVVYHPVINGQPVSGRSPEVQAIGTVYKAVFNGRLQAEAWFDIESTRLVDPRVLAALEKGDPIELSTGLFTTNEAKDGTHLGKPYKFVARDYVPDHLAVLPDQVGACSVKDGCGILVNTATNQLFYREINTPEPVKRDRTVKDKYIKWLTTNCSCWKNGKEDLEKMSEERLKTLKINAEKAMRAEVVANAAKQGFTEGNVTGKWDEEAGKFVVNTMGKKTKPVETDDDPEPKPKPAAKVKTTKEWMDEAPPEVKSAVSNAMSVVKQKKKELVEKLVANRKAKGITDEEAQAYGVKMWAKDLEDLQERVDDLPTNNTAPGDVDGIPNFLGNGTPTRNSGKTNEPPEDDMLGLVEIGSLAEAK